MSEFNINIRNLLGKGASARNRLSAKGSIARNNNTKQQTNNFNFKKVGSGANTLISSTASGSGLSGAFHKAMKGAGVGAVVGLTLTAAEKVGSFAISYRESKTGEQIWAHNAKTTLKTVTTLGSNYLFGALNNELFRKKEISRTNYGLDYGRELYAINVEGSKNKRI